METISLVAFERSGKPQFKTYVNRSEDWIKEKLKVAEGETTLLSITVAQTKTITLYGKRRKKTIQIVD